MKRIEISQEVKTTSIVFFDNEIFDEVITYESDDKSIPNQIFAAFKEVARNLLTNYNTNIFICDIIKKGKRVGSFLVSASDIEEAETIMRYDNEEAIKLMDQPLFQNNVTLSFREVDPSIHPVKIY